MAGVIHVHIELQGADFEAARYAFRVLLASAEVPVVYHGVKPTNLAPDDILVTYSRSRTEPSHRRHLVVCASQSLWDHYGKQASLPPSPLPRVRLEALGAAPGVCLEDPCVLPYVAEAVPPAMQVRREPSGSGVTMMTGADLVASTFFWITRYEESLIVERDDVGRVPQERLRVLQEGLAKRPLVDEYSELLAAWLKALGARMDGQRPPFRVMLTHDVDSGIDVSGAWEHARSGVRTLLRETLRQGRPRTGLLGLGEWALRGLGLREEAAHCREIVHIDGESGVPSFFFFMANGTNPRDASYDVTSAAARSVITAIRGAGGRTGLHVGLNAHHAPEQLKAEWERLREADPDARPVARSHYLAFFTPSTWRHLVELGFVADSTLGFSRHIGFRCGTSRAFRPFDVERRELLPLWEIPMNVMDVNLFRVRAGDAARVSEVRDLAARVRAHRGCLVMNWHNVYCFGHYRRVYREILKTMRDARGLSPDEVPVDEGLVIW